MTDTARLYEKIADIPQIKRGIVWCKTCGRSQKVNGGGCIRTGWPKCCGYTMTIDSPEERIALRARDPNMEG